MNDFLLKLSKVTNKKKETGRDKIYNTIKTSNQDKKFINWR